jgi:POT family proton-dependent oligopeptide transporter
VDQADKMNLYFFGHLWKSSQIQVVNPILVLLYVPLFTFFIYPFVNKYLVFSPLRRMSVGFFFAVVSFLIPAWVESQIGAGLRPSIGWQLLAYMFLMASEVLIYATGLEFSYTQSPKRMKSMVMSFFLATNSAGNLFTAAVNYYIQNKDGTVKLEGAVYYLFFAGLMFAAAIVFIFVAMFYKGKTFIQDVGEVPIEALN